MNELARAKRRYRFGGIFMQTLVRGMVILAVASGVVLSVQVTEESNKKAHQTFQFFSIMLPLMASVMITLEATIRPSLKRSLLLLAEKRIESEMYRFVSLCDVYSLFRIVSLDLAYIISAFSFSELVLGFTEASLPTVIPTLCVVQKSELFSWRNAKRLLNLASNPMWVRVPSLA